MATTYWTLVAGGVEKTLEGWGLCDDFGTRFVNKGKSTITFRTNERFDGATPQFTSFPAWFRANPTGNPATQLVQMWRDRTAVGSGGTLYFQGYFDDPERRVSGGEEHVHYQLHNVLWLFERNHFKQHRKQITAIISGVPTLVDKVCTEIFLGESPASVQWTNGAQIGEVVGWMNESYNPTRRGASSGMDLTKDVVRAGTINPATLMPITRVNTVYCLEVLNSCVRWSPDAVYKVDNTTTPPTLHVLTMGRWNYATSPPTFLDYTNLPEVTINITAQQEKDISLMVQNSRQLPGVIIYYLSSATVDSQTVPVIIRDAYPTTISDWYPEASCHAVELAGAKVTHVTASVTTEAIADAVSGTEGTRAAWWLAHDKALNDPNIASGSVKPGVATVKDDAGADVDTGALPNVLLGTIPEWVLDQFGLTVVHATVRSKVAYDRYNESGHVIPDVSKTGHFLTHSVKLTDAITWPYSAVSSSDPGEMPPQGVAESVYRGVAIAQCAGSITLRDDQLRSDIYIGCRLKLAGPTTTFVNILPQMIETRPCQGITTVQFGPSAPVDADALIELARATRWRMVYNMPSGRATGTGSGSNSNVDATAKAPSENTSPSVGAEKQRSVIFQQV